MKYLFAAAVALMLCSCSTVTQGVNQQVAVTTPGVEAATCTLKDQQERNLGTVITPGSVTLPKGRRGIEVTCEKPGYERAVATLPLSFANRSRIQAPVGYVVDGLSGAMWTYPPEVSVRMKSASRQN
jgi:hypothetical protein